MRWNAAYPLSLRHIEEMMAGRSVAVDHATVHRWAIKILSVLAAVFCRRKRPVGMSWRMDETCIKVAGEWKYLYRAVGRDGHTIDFLLRAKRDCAAARFKTFRCARALVAGIEAMHMIRNGQLNVPESQASSAASRFYSLAL